VVIKSTLLPGTTARLQNDFPTLVLLHSPEFLSVATAAHDAAHPWGNIIGLGADSVRHAVAAVAVRAILPRAPFNLTCSGTQAELIKYAHNLSAIMQILTVNTLFDVAQQEGESWGPVAAALAADPTIPARYSNPVFNGQRGAGGGCFIKDLVAFAGLSGSPLLRAAEQYNRTLLTEQDRDLADAVYGLDTSRKLV
jgi:UDPglucose 6-dehydrogenase